MKKSNNIPFHLFFTALALTIIAVGCSLGGPDPTPVPQTRILEIRLTPDTVAVGDTVLIHAVIEDSLDASFEFNWSFNEERKVPVNGTIIGSKIRWWANGFENLNSGQVNNIFRSVRVDNGSEDLVSVTEVFQILVIKQ